LVYRNLVKKVPLIILILVINYTLHQLDIFVKVAETLSITRAADLLFLTQPAVSIQLKKFQEQFDNPLIEVINKRVQLTELGKEVLPLAKDIIHTKALIKETVSNAQKLLQGTLKFASVSTGKYVLPYFLKQFFDKHNLLNLEMEVNNRKNVINDFLNNNVDFALVSVLP
jgi:DNA-binding transcriptional LysR family regulator